MERGDGVTGVVLAGGRGSRMEGLDKGLVPVGGLAMVDHVIRALRPQVDALVINANRERGTYRARGALVVPDGIGGFPGPLAGLLAALEVVTTPWVVTAPCDVPVLPRDLVARLRRCQRTAATPGAVVWGAGRRQPALALVPVALAGDLAAFLEAGGRSVTAWQQRHGFADCVFDDPAPAFANVNTPQDRAELEGILGSG